MCSTESCDTGGDESWFGEIQCSNSTSDVDGTPSAVSYTDSEGEPLFGVSPEGRSAVPYCEVSLITVTVPKKAAPLGFSRLQLRTGGGGAPISALRLHKSEAHCLCCVRVC